MKTYKYRVAHIVCNSQLKPNGGIGAGVQSCVQMFQDLGAQCDLITDIPPSSIDKDRVNFLQWFKNNQCQIITPTKPLNYTLYKTLAGNRDTINHEETINFRNSICKALHKNIYNLFVVHSTQAGLSLYGLDIVDKIPSVIYTHDFNAVFKTAPGDEGRGMCTVSITRFNDMVYRLPGYIIGTHTERNAKEINHSTALCLPLPLTAKDLLNPLTQEEKDKQNGVLFIGRWEPRKDPEAYCDLIAQTKLPAKLLVSSKQSINNFEKAFEKRGITDYEFARNRYPEARQRGFVNQEEKCDFIRSCKVSFLPYVYEAYGLAQYEALTSMPGVVYKHNVWHENFAQFPHLYKETKQTAPQKVIDLHKDNHKSAQQEIIAYEKTVPNNWKTLLNSQIPLNNVKPSSRFSKHNNIWHHEVISKLKRDMSIEDVHSILNAQSLFKRYYTLTDTWYTKDNTLPTNEAELVWANANDFLRWSRGL